MEQHIITMQDLVDKLTALGEEIKDHLFVAMLLSSLPESYSTLITALESRPETELTLDLVKGRLLNEYKRRKVVPDASEENTALKASQRGGGTTCEGKRSCFFCHKQGHFKQDCIKYKKWKTKKENGEKAIQVDAEEKQSGFICFSARQGKTQKNTWYIDSGATSHMTRNRIFFNVFESRKLPDVTLANGLSVQATGISSGVMRCIDGNYREVNIKLNDVLYVPDLTESLLSVRKLAEKGLIVQFKDKECKIVKNNAVIVTAVLSSNMYALEAMPKAQWL